MKQFIFLAFLLVSVAISGQNIETMGFTDQIKKYDISDLWTLDKFYIDDDTVVVERNEPIGYIGDGFQRFYIHIISAIQNPDNPLQYLIYGKTKVKTNICTFQGLITVTNSETFDVGEIPDLKQGVVQGKYEFFEDPDQRGTGIFTGEFTTSFYLDRQGEIQYDALMFAADGFQNNQFKGQWTSYKSGKSKTCNWGDYRIPESVNLDVGTGEFYPNEKYSTAGWENYLKAMGYSSDKTSEKIARQIEDQKWWLDSVPK